MKVTIVSPEKILYEGDAESIKLPGTKGRFEVLNRHAPIIQRSAMEMWNVKELNILR